MQRTFFNIYRSKKQDEDVYADHSLFKIGRIPKVFVWTRHLQEVRIQGRQGTSLAHVGALMMEWKQRKTDKKIIKMSPQYLYNLREDKESNQMCARELMEIMQKNGCCPEKDLPHGILENTEESNESAAQNKIPGYGRILTIKALQRAINVYGPCLMVFPVYNFNIHMWKQHEGEERLGGHAFAVVGYNAKGFILRNSWGAHWNGNGHTLYPYKDWGLHEEAWTIMDDSKINQWKDLATRALHKMVSIMQLKTLQNLNDYDSEAMYKTFKEKEIKEESNDMKKKTGPKKAAKKDKKAEEKKKGKKEKKEGLKPKLKKWLSFKSQDEEDEEEEEEGEDEEEIDVKEDVTEKEVAVDVDIEAEEEEEE